MGGQRQRIAPGQHAAQLCRRFVFFKSRVLSLQPQLHTAGADGGQQRVQRVGAEYEGGVGRTLLHDLQQHVLIPLVQLGTVGEQIDLPLALVGPDVDVLPQRPDGIHRQLLAVVVPHLRHVGMDALHHLAAGIALQAGTLPLTAAQVRRGNIAGRGQLVPLAGQDHRVAQLAPVRRRADGAGPCAVIVCRLCHRFLRSR